MMSLSYHVLVMATFLAVSVYCYPNGQGLDSACSELTPNHGPSSQTNNAPYSIAFNPSTYTPNRTVSITLTSSSTGFKGFMIQARRADNQNQELLGSFSGDSATTRQACSGKALVHSEGSVKSSLTFNWIAPATLVGNITFRVTYVQTKITFWSNRQSGVLVGQAGSGGSAVTVGYFLIAMSAVRLLLSGL